MQMKHSVPFMSPLSIRSPHMRRQPFHYGLFASANRAETIARARELLGLATPAAEEAVEIDPAAAQALAQPCPCCGGRMFVIETFDAGCQPRYRPAAMRIDTS